MTGLAVQVLQKAKDSQSGLAQFIELEAAEREFRFELRLSLHFEA